MKLFKEFKDFAVKGNMMDMAIGIIIGAAFNKVIDVLVKQVMLPPLSLLSGNMDIQDMRIVLKNAIVAEDGTVAKEEVAIGYGALIEAAVDFFIIGFTIFVVVKFMNRLIKKAEDTKDKTVTTPKNIELLTSLNGLMKEQNELLKSQIQE
ncbi:large conductance mechanosensitive channel protein MscL [Lutimonas saemankumensis]|uniref:large conductance mechanosensitive channel protein MscL n=1 Tax=Lutimonas saemankumensis TaxID=483016 RepID=UPI001CD60613|nr:large conductance mechanosensitive channel protein MscL [Lutimonas saemankumensis]MCA0932516.1 large conductance mechanosensitive channel protein MscL [Lutimonas saemankumensis]